MDDELHDASDHDSSSDRHDEFEEHLYKATSHQEYDDRLLESLQKAREDIGSFVVDEFITEAYVAATHLRNVLGDSDGGAAELANIVLSNLIVVLQNVTNDPASFVLAYVRAIKDDDLRKDRMKVIIDKLDVASKLI